MTIYFQMFSREIFFASYSLRCVFKSVCFKLSILSKVAIRTHFHFKTQYKIQATNELMY